MIAALLGVLVTWLAPLCAGPYTATHGPETALRAKRAAEIAGFAIMSVATVLAAMIVPDQEQLCACFFEADEPAAPLVQSTIEFDCTFRC